MGVHGKNSFWRYEMNEKESLSERFESFIGGKGFYIVLFAAIAVIGITAWLLVSPAEIASENYGDNALTATETLPSRPEQTQAPASEKPESGSAAVPKPEKTAPVMNPVEVPIEEEPKPSEPERRRERRRRSRRRMKRVPERWRREPLRRRARTPLPSSPSRYP